MPNDHSRNLVFLWENLGPMHVDRLSALTAALPDHAVIALQYAERSETYEWRQAERDRRYTIETLGGMRRPSAPVLAWRIVRACLRRKSVLFFCHYEHVAVLVAAMTMRLLGRRVYAMIDSKFDDYPRRLGRELGKSIFLLPYHGALTASPRSRDYLRFLGLPEDRLVLGYDTLSVERLADGARAATAPAVSFAERDFVVVARLVPKKNIALAIEAFALWLADTATPRDLHLCGSGPLEAELRAAADRLGVAARVHFHGFVQSDAVAARLARALCLILPSVEEQFGLVVIEAQAVGVPVLVTRNAGACDMLIEDGVNGFTFAPTSARSCAALMLLVSEDEARWRQLSAGALTHRDRGDVRHFVAGVLALAEPAATGPSARA
jgi:glycosyltransferase involved in cell wall biosynthesis